jgi:hypothetical protein
MGPHRVRPEGSQPLSRLGLRQPTGPAAQCVQNRGRFHRGRPRQIGSVSAGLDQGHVVTIGPPLPASPSALGPDGS